MVEQLPARAVLFLGDIDILLGREVGHIRAPLL
jgi:hypothetical protein